MYIELKLIFSGGKSYSLQTEDKKKNDELIMESAKKLHGGLLLTDDKNLLVSFSLLEEYEKFSKNKVSWLYLVFGKCIFKAYFGFLGHPKGLKIGQ